MPPSVMAAIAWSRASASKQPQPNARQRSLPRCPERIAGHKVTPSRSLDARGLPSSGRGIAYGNFGFRRDHRKSLHSFEGRPHPERPLRLSFEAPLAGAPQDEAKGSRGTRPPQDEEVFLRLGLS